MNLLANEKKKLDIDKLDLEVLRENKKEQMKKGGILDSIQKFAFRFNLTKKNDFGKSEEIITDKSNDLEKPLNQESIEKKGDSSDIDIVTINMKMIEHAPKIFNSLRKRDGIDYSHIIE